MSQQSPVADAACEETVSRPVEVVSSPMVETLPASSSAVVAQPARAQRGFKDVLADMCASMSVPQATALLVVVVALTGVTFPLVKFVSTAFDSPTILAGRFLVASVCLLPWLDLNRKLLLAGAETGAWLSAGLLSQAMCLASGTSAGVCSFFASMSCIVCPFLETCFGVRLTAQSWVAAALAVAGTGFLCLGNGALPSPGDLLGLLQPLLFGIYLFRVERRMAQHPGKAMELTTLQCLFVCAFAALWSLASHPASALALPALGQWCAALGAEGAALAAKGPQLAGLAFMGVFSSAFVLAAQTMVVSKLSSSKTALMFATEPLFAAAVAWALLSEGFGLNMVVGGALATLACVTASSSRFYNKMAAAALACKRLLLRGSAGSRRKQA